MRAWLTAHIPKRLVRRHDRAHGNPAYLRELTAWQRALTTAGYVAMGPGNGDGQGAGILEQTILSEELVLARAPAQIGIMGVQMVRQPIDGVGFRSSAGE